MIFSPWPHRPRVTRSKAIHLRRKYDPKHGTISAYQKGCGCVPCRAANREAQRKKRSGWAA